MTLDQALVLALFVGVYALFATKVLPPALAALLGALVLAGWNGLASVLPHVVGSVLLATAGLMVLSGFVKRSGWASWLALNTIRLTRGNPWGIFLLAGLLSFLSGAFWGPLAAVFLIAPVALLLASELDVPSIPFVVVLSWSALLGGATVLTAQPGNLWMGAVLGIDSGRWLLSMIPFTGTAFLVTLLVGIVLFRKDLRATNERRARILEFDAAKSLGDRRLVVSTAVVAVVVLGFLAASPWLGLSPALVMASGALALVIWNRGIPLERSLSEIDGGTLLFYGGLFIVVGALAFSGLPNLWAKAIPPQPLAVLWAAAFLSAFVDPGAVASASIPLLQEWAKQGGTVWPFVAVGTAVGGSIAAWSSVPRSAIELAGTPRSVVFKKLAAYGTVLAVVNLAAVSLVALWIR